MATATGLVITKRFTYRGLPDEEWSNKYWFTGAPPATDQAWMDLFNDVQTHERKCYSSATKVVSAIGYNDNDPHAHAVWTFAFGTGTEPPGELTGDAADNPFAGDQAGMLEIRTSRKNTRGKWVYLRKFLHSGFSDGVDRDKISANTHLAYTVFLTYLSNGTVLGSRRLRSQKQDETLTVLHAGDWVTTRTLKRRGKRP